MDSVLPLGRDNWEQVATRYNTRRPRGTCERDFEALRRKFRNLYGNLKPTGINGDVPEAKKPILMHHELQRAIELKAGSTLLTKEHAESVADTDGDSSSGLQGTRGEHRGQQQGAEDHIDQHDGFEGTQAIQSPLEPYEDSEDFVLASRDALLPNTEPRPIDDRDDARGGSALDEALTSESGFLRLQLDSADDLPAEVSTVAGKDAAVIANEGVGLSPQASEPGMDGNISRRVMGRPRRSTGEAIPSQASPNGPILQRNPDNEAADTAEMARYRRQSVTSNRLGGRDLRVLRDNFGEMGGRPKTPTEKRPVSDSSITTTFASNKRNCARKRLGSLESFVSNMPDFSEFGNKEIMQIMTFFQRQGHQRAEMAKPRYRGGDGADKDAVTFICVS
ncbi:hypothetical protein DVH05_012608 [Phytophthora capsici]|nr:hypothetical protein DVH05_012608 [Phytophthora capsici]